MVDLRKLHENLSDEQRQELTEHRGGCRCHLDPPCGSCCDPLELEEALDLGFIEGDNDESS